MHDQLLQQARRLAKLDPGKPKGVNLRRAISAAYYALFHFLVDQSCRGVIGRQHRQTALRQVLGRAFDHTAMRQACKSFAGGTLPSAVSKGLPASFTLPNAIKDLGRIFVQLQVLRHVADYDMTERFRRSDVLALIRKTNDAAMDFKDLPISDEKKFFLAC